MDNNDTGTASRVEEVMVGTRWVRRGDTVKVTRGGTDATGFFARFSHIDKDGFAVVFGGSGFKPEHSMEHQTGRGAFRTVSPSRLRPKDQTVQGRPVFHRPRSLR